jgi:potassium-transporting ATPase KdpC subunit
MKTLIVSIKAMLLLSLLTGILYPLLITGIAMAFFPKKANGSLIMKNDTLIGSGLIGQKFSSAVYFHSRPSASGYSALPSGGTNLGPTNHKLLESVLANRKTFLELNDLDSITFIPSEMVFASGSGLDPHISPKAALLQADRVARSRKFSAAQRDKLIRLIENLTEPPQFLMLGEERINILQLNIALDEIR